LIQVNVGLATLRTCWRPSKHKDLLSAVSIKEGQSLKSDEVAR
jgi:hypothetical protein